MFRWESNGKRTSCKRPCKVGKKGTTESTYGDGVHEKMDFIVKVTKALASHIS
jgi:hypothetical protein